MGPVQHLPVVALASVGAMLVLSSCGPDRDTAPPPTAASPTASPTVDPRLLPNLSTLTATSISVETDEDGERILRFGTILANTGAGPVEVIPDPDSPCPEGQRFFAQEVRLDADGDRTYEPDVDTESVRHGGECALFHPDHRHWHIDGSAEYELKDTTGTTVASRHKVSYCLRDSMPLHDG